MINLTLPSYMIPAGYAENVEFIASIPQVKCVELLFFMWDHQTEALFSAEKSRITAFTDTLEFAVHMPDLIEEKHGIILDYTRPWSGRYIVHPPEGDPDDFIRLLNSWRNDYGEIFCLENLIGREFLALLPRLPGIPVCIDTGHLLINKTDPAEFIGGIKNPIHEIHLHGLKDGRDHKPFPADAKWFKRLAPFLREFRGAVNLEVFHYNDAREISASLAQEGLLDTALPDLDVPPPPAYDTG